MLAEPLLYSRRLLRLNGKVDNATRFAGEGHAPDASDKKSAEPLQPKRADAVCGAGGDPGTVMKELKASLAQYNAAH
jgi:hypothetical protein